MHFIRGRILSLGAAIAVALGVSSAHASSFALLEQSASRLGSAFAGTAATAEDASTLYFNPAGLTELKAFEFTVVATGIGIGSSFDNHASQAAFLQPLGPEGGDAGSWNFVPAAYVSMPIGDAFAIGLGINAPFGLRLVYDTDWMGRFQAERSEIQTYNFNPAFAWRVSDQFSLGIGANYQRLQAKLTNEVNYSAVVAQGIGQGVIAGTIPPAAAPGLIAANAGLQGGASIRGDDGAWGFNVGLLFDPTPTTRLGLTYRSAIDYTVKGTAHFSPPTTTQPVGAAIIAAVSAPGGPLSNSGASVDLKVPDSATLSLAQKLTGQWTLLADIAWTGWSSVQELRVVRNDGTLLSLTPERWTDSWRYSIGTSFAINQAFKLRGGLAYDTTPVPDATRTARVPDPDRKWVAIGAQWLAFDAMTLDVGYAHLFSDSAPIHNDEGNARAYGLLDGQQDTSINIISAQLTYRF
jgi:long-chain fatty acid transport protein